MAGVWATPHTTAEHQQSHDTLITKLLAVWGFYWRDGYANSRCVVWISSMANGSSHLLSLLNVAFLPLCLSTGVRECRKDILAKTSRRAKMSSKRVKELSDSLPPAVSWAYKPTVTLFTNMFNPKSPFANNYFYTWTVGFTSISLKNENQRAGLSRMIISLNKPA